MEQAVKWAAANNIAGVPKIVSAAKKMKAEPTRPRASPRNNGTPKGVVPVETDPDFWLAEAERVRAQRGD